MVSTSGGVRQISSDRDNRMGAKIKTHKKSLGIQTKPQEILRPKFNPKKSHAEFPSHKNFQKALNDITRKIQNTTFRIAKKSLLK